MPTVHRAHGLRFVIFVNDHEPAHVHAIRGGGEAKIELGRDGAPPRLVWVKGLSRADARLAIDEAAQHGAQLLNDWNRLHGPRND